jgi:hypothetical protein
MGDVGVLAGTRPRCERWAHSGGRLGERCRSRIRNGDGPLLGCQSRVVLYCERCGVPLVECVHRSGVSSHVDASESAVSGPVSVTCSCCGADMAGRNADTRFCSGRCRQRSRRGRCETEAA